MNSILRSGLLLAAMMVAFAMPAVAKDKTLVKLDGTQGEDVFASLTQGRGGILYGTTEFGGANTNGTIFQVSTKGKYKVLHSFCSQNNCTDGANGEWLTQGSDGNFYGQTYGGGNANVGTIFEITPSGKYTTLYSFCSQSNCTDGATPQSSLVQTSDGSFYGTTTSGGANNKGTVFKFVPGGPPKVLYSFCAKSGCSDGSFPLTGLTLASDGNFYGVTAEGGNIGADCPLQGYGCGTVFRIAPGGSLETIYTFCKHAGCLDGDIPQGNLIQAADDDLYGTTDAGGSSAAQGTVFKISLEGKLTTVHAFCANGECSDGAIPYAGVIQAKDGNIYGTTDLGGPSGWGAVYRITAKGEFTTVFSFDMSDGADVAAGVTQASDGNLYGGTEEGGSNNCKGGCGVLFRVSPKGGNAIAFDRLAGHAGTIPTNRPRPAIPVTPLGAHEGQGALPPGPPLRTSP